MAPRLLRDVAWSGVEFLFLLLLWIIFVSKFTGQEFAVGIVAAAAGAIGDAIVKREGLAAFRPHARWVLLIFWEPFNLLDNMDGLSPGVAFISAGWVLVLYFGTGDRAAARLISLFAGSTAGFLIFNFHPARILMGDCGSLFLGCGLATTSLLPAAHRYTSAKNFFVPLMILAVPVLDMVFVAATRRLRGQPISQGGTDHSSHRLVRLGLGERSAVSLLYGLSILSGAVAIMADRVAVPHALASMALLLLGFFLLAVVLFF